MLLRGRRLWSLCSLCSVVVKVRLFQVSEVKKLGHVAVKYLVVYIPMLMSKKQNEKYC